MVDNRQGDDRRPSRRDDGDARRGQRPQRDRPQGPRRPGSDRNGRPPQSRDASTSDRPAGPRLPDDVEAKQLSPEVRRELTTLDKATADYVAKHLVMAGDLIEEDPEAALEHARAARARASRIAAIREAVGIAAYYCGDWAQALSELRAARRMGSKSPLLALIADCERGVGRPERAIELGRSPEAEQLTGDDADELKIVLAGARCDLGQPAQALALLSNPPLDSTRTGQTAARLFYVYAETLLALDRTNDALQWFLHAAAADLEGVTDAEDRAAELG
ncbi:tetratricopeptide repeat protein [Mycolicibacterium llatzerense]|uniref:tetratricopeptide repeat protein n=1 Tax=Mycolicibacterium llatzerense TaxID=280871 RepID=UPI0021B6A44B|nr:tetratricopeptide repeat protein [Mycolicibacterium llatzerense]